MNETLFAAVRKSLESAGYERGYFLEGIHGSFGFVPDREAEPVHFYRLRNHEAVAALDKIEAALKQILNFPFDVGHTPENDVQAMREIARGALDD